VSVSADRDVEGLRIVLPASGALKGTVRDAQGRPVAKVEVSMHDGKRWLNAAVADDGSFRFESVASGEYRVQAKRDWEAMRAPGTSDDDVQGEKVSIREGGVETVQLVVAGAAEKIAGVVRDEDGGPVADAFIEATLESDSAAASGNAARRGRWGGFFSAPNLSDADGRFTLAELSPGKHTLRAHRKGGGEAILEHVESGSDVVLTIAATGRMSGTVALRGAGPPEDFTISVYDEQTGFRRNDSFFRTGGAWSLAELPAGTYKVKVGAGGGSAEVEAKMTAGEDTTGLRVELVPKVTVRGTVVDLDGKPVPGLSVSVSDGGRRMGRVTRRSSTSPMPRAATRSRRRRRGRCGSPRVRRTGTATTISTPRCGRWSRRADRWSSCRRCGSPRSGSSRATPRATSASRSSRPSRARTR
jgi:hypothetical protein